MVVNIEDSVFENNTAFFDGGAIFGVVSSSTFGALLLNVMYLKSPACRSRIMGISLAAKAMSSHLRLMCNIVPKVN